MVFSVPICESIMGCLILSTYFSVSTPESATPRYRHLKANHMEEALSLVKADGADNDDTPWRLAAEVEVLQTQQDLTCT